MDGKSFRTARRTPYRSALGAGIVIFGLWQIYRAVTRDKNKRVALGRTRFRLAISALGVYGLLARGTLFCLVGGYLINAAWRHDPRYSGGIAGALGGLKQQPYGEWLLGILASGCCATDFIRSSRNRIGSWGRADESRDGP